MNTTLREPFRASCEGTHEFGSSCFLGRGRRRGAYDSSGPPSDPPYSGRFLMPSRVSHLE
jgi:hypothetical protein